MILAVIVTIAVHVVSRFGPPILDLVLVVVEQNSQA